MQFVRRCANIKMHIKFKYLQYLPVTVTQEMLIKEIKYKNNQILSFTLSLINERKASYESIIIMSMNINAQ